MQNEQTWSAYKFLA